MDMEHARFNMIEQQIRPWNVLDAHVLQLLEVVKREDFVPLAHKALAFVDMEIPLPGGQCMLAPRVEARMLQDLAVHKHEKVLEIGTGCGYQAAVLSLLAKEVYSIERLRGLHDRARDNLRAFRLANVHLLFGDGMAGYAKGAPYAGIEGNYNF